MNQKNFDYLRDQVKYTGFGDALENPLKEKLAADLPQFTISHEPKIGSQLLSSTLYFRRSEQNDMYFFNKYELEKKSDDGQNLKQTFFINKGSNITLKEAYNLLDGRAVNKDLTNKEGQLYNAWMQIDFKQHEASGNFKMNQYHQNYGYDLSGELTKLPLKELADNQERASLMRSLQKGNLQSVTLIEGNMEQKLFVEANPQYKTINLYDANMKKLEPESLMRSQTLKTISPADSHAKRQLHSNDGMRERTSDTNANNTTRKRGLSP